eukprot:GFYU01015386.1.p1 GENE.GFYU01015386.1~~GFYU01015386.1.p1  ORF type:complete len:496 (-),score=148.58 GFYU01015386.1:53-1540(-)
MSSAIKTLSSDSAEFEEWIKRLTPLVTQYLQDNLKEDTKVVEFLPPKELCQLIGTELPEHGQSYDEIESTIKTAMKYSVRTGHRRFMDKLYVGSDVIGQMAEWIAAVLNTNVHTYAVAPVFAVMEVELLRQMCKIVGFGENGDGILCPGGSYGNLLCMVLARNTLFPEIRLHGNGDKRLVAFTSVQAHYSIKRAAMVLGMGAIDGCIAVDADSKGCMKADDLEKKIQQAIGEGKTPFFISSTAGTTVMGGFDPFNEIAEIAKKYNLWFHVDGCWGGSVVMSEKHKHLVSGIEKARSIVWNPHKMLGVPLQCTAVLVSEKGLLAKSNASNAEYLFHPHEAADYDLGDKTLQCGRKSDSFKMWLSWKRHGRAGFAERVDKSFALVEHLVAQIEKRNAADGSFILVEKPMCSNVCFWYVPKAHRGKSLEEIKPILDETTMKIYDMMQRAGKMLVNFNPLPDHNLPRFFRAIISSDRLDVPDMEFILDEIQTHGESLTL